MTRHGADSRTTSRSQVVAWALWDCGATGVNAVVITFVFSVYLTEQVGSGLPGPTTPASWLGRVLTIAGLFVALLAPATGIWVDATHRRRAVSFLVPWMFFTFIDLFGTDRADMGDLCVVLAAGLMAMMIAVRVPRET
jgi:UMF1 family MFS transporter